LSIISKKSLLSQTIWKFNSSSKALTPEQPPPNKDQNVFEALFQAAADARDDRIRLQPRDGHLPLSIGQQRFWFFDQYEPGNPAHNVCQAYEILGYLDPKLLENSLNRIVARHEILRTSYQNLEGNPVQSIAPTQQISVEIVDISFELDEIQNDEVTQQCIKRIQTGFDLTRLPLWRVTLFRLGDERFLLLLVVHHIIMDGWSFGVLLDELSTFYLALEQGQEPDLPDLSLQYGDYAIWQQARFATMAANDPHFEYWQRQLVPQPPLLTLPLDFDRPELQTYRGARQSFSIPMDTKKRVETLCQQANITKFMFLLAVINVWLFRYTGQNEISIGTVAANRNRPELNDLIGFFVNGLVMRTSLKPELRGWDVFHLARETVLGGLQHQETPFEKLVELLQFERNLRRLPVFDVFTQFRNYPQPRNLSGTLTLKPFELPVVLSAYDLAFEFTEGDDHIRCDLSYNTDLFAAPTISRMLAHFNVLLTSILENPARPISSLPLLTEQERQKILVEWNDTNIQYPDPQLLPQLFEEQATQHPDALAVDSGQEQITYAALNKRANQLARFLTKYAVGPEKTVGIFLPRSIEWIIGILGTLKAGGVYVPLDLAQPDARIARMLAQSHIEVVVTQTPLLSRLPAQQLEVICLDRDRDAISAEKSTPPKSMVTGANSAYVYHTSGSTGQPKGVVVTHQAVCNRLLWGQQTYRRNNTDRVLQQFSASFDFSAWEIFIALVAGAGIVIADEAERIDSAALVQKMADHGVTIAGFVPSMLQYVLDDPGFRKCTQLRQVFCSAEIMTVDLQRKFEANLSAELYNTYGPTEASIDVTHWKCEPGDSFSEAPIGYPLANTRIYILTADLQPAPVGVTGELYIAGIGLARGYINQPAPTAEVFIPDPYSPIPGERMYRTGDLACYLPDGNLKYRGRKDHQVKIRGYRIELGEIEAILREIAGIGAAVVLARKILPGDRSLVAYIQFDSGDALGVSELASELKQFLPDYMIPVAFVFLETFPVTPNGKIDRRALPAVNQESVITANKYQPPRDDLERCLVQIWEQVLKVHQIGIDDNYFELGGHSLLAVKLFSLIEKSLGVRLPLASLFQAPTIRLLTEVYQGQAGNSLWASLVPIQPHGITPPLFCVHGVGGNVVGFHKLASYLPKNQPVYGLQAQGLDGKTQPLTTIEAMAAKYVDEIVSDFPTGPYMICGHSLGGRIAVEMAIQLIHLGRQVGMLALLDTSADPFPMMGKFGILKAYLRISFERVIYHFKGILLTNPINATKHIKNIFRRINRRINVRKLAKRFDQDDVNLPKHLQSVKDANRGAAMNYQFKKYSGKITLFKVQDSSVGLVDQQNYGWQYFAGELEIHEVTGNHTTLIDEPHVKILAAKLENCIDRVILNS
jgi:amino acid adenylation domain-containing protein